ncbi:uncharacterized protein TNCV_1375401 [Trichonephila clavipes]|nr:uncharacterized protein TNCV_1375401 [Trichonephila clavipes]
MPRRRIRAHYEQLSEFERGRIIGLKEEAQRFVDGILTVLPPFLLQYPGLIFPHNNAKPHTACVAMKCLIAYQTLPWPARSPNLSAIEHVWDMMGRRLHLPGNADDLARQLEQIWKKYRRRPSGCFITLCHVVWQLASRLELGQHFIELVTI